MANTRNRKKRPSTGAITTARKRTKTQPISQRSSADPPPAAAPNQRLLLVDLPPEIFQRIIRHIVIGGQNREVFVVRQVSRLFDVEIIAELIWTCHIRDASETGAILCWASHLPLVERLLSTLATSQRNSTAALETPMLRVIRDAAKAIADYKDEHSPAMELFYSLKVCSVVFAHQWRGNLSVFAQHWRGELAAFPRSPRLVVEYTDSDIWRTGACVALLLDDDPMRAYFYSKVGDSSLLNHSSFIVPSAPWAAAKGGNVRILRQMRNDKVPLHGLYDNGLWHNANPMTAACADLRPENHDAVLVILESYFEQGMCVLARQLSQEITACIKFAGQTGSRKLFSLLTELNIRRHYEFPLGQQLYNCCARRNLALVKFLLEHGVNPNVGTGQSPENGKDLVTSLQMCVYNKDVEMVRILLASAMIPADPNKTSATTPLPLQIAVQNNDVACITALLAGGALARGLLDSESGGCVNFDVLFQAATLRHIKAMKAIIPHYHISTSQSYHDSACESLVLAVETGDLEMARVLVDAGCSIHGQWDPPLPGTPFADLHDKRIGGKQGSRKKEKEKQKREDDGKGKGETKKELPPRHRMLSMPLIKVALRAGNQQAAAFLLSRGAVWRYPYDYLLKRPGESANSVEKRVALVRRAAEARDAEEDMAEQAAEEEQAQRQQRDAQKAKQAAKARTKRLKELGEMEWDPEGDDSFEDGC
ncbi:hypothetical protein MPH_11219 [Macrophomina phaseolina MS6]|uniref:Uncharacterized protein n=1 Tax=Macrophomina phaseolina (strain MS6) TaxID=1126212 RepID=K2QP61_MACPH|nr:hypothetical protein MPH_11219 [Macrophomina phaseolina MS6]